MFQSHSFELLPTFPVSFAELAEVRQRVPTRNGDIPIQVEGKFDIVQPQLELGENVLRFALAEPFAFFREVRGRVITTQKIDSMTLETTPQPGVWRAILDTEAALTDVDKDFVGWGVAEYVDRAHEKIRFPWRRK